jgi:tetratricopeptide (TPR) repeat protein
MIAATALAAAAAAAASAALEPAQAAFARGEYDRAETLALAAAEPPQAGAALYLVGLARFRAGHPAEALEALEQAARASDPPALPLWHYNRGACLYELGRFREAESAYLEAADLDASLRTVSLVNAGFAALDGGSPERARALSIRARATASEQEAQLVTDLDAHISGAGADRATEEYRDGLTAYDAGRFEEARQRFRRAAELDPSDGRSLIMSGASAFHLGARREARSDLERALRLPLAAADAQAARDYLAAASHGLAGRQSWEGTLRLGAGFDNDPLQTGWFEQNEFPRFAATQAASPIATASLGLAWHPPSRGNVFSEVAYAFDELAYLAVAARDRSLQQHELALAVELAASDDLRLGGSLTGQLAFTGISGFRGLQAAAGTGAWAALDEGERASTRVDLAWTPKTGLASEFSYLTGSRLDAAITQQFRIGALAFDLGYRFRADLIGTSVQPVQAAPSTVPCSGGCAVDPLSYVGNAIWVTTRASAAQWPGSLELTSGFESRDYLDDSYLLTAGDGITNLRRRHDQRWFGGIAASVRLTGALSLTMRYDLVLNRSNTSGRDSSGRGPGEAFDTDDRSYDRHVLLLRTDWSW